jgi:hypothetical protein
MLLPLTGLRTPALGALEPRWWWRRDTEVRQRTVRACGLGSSGYGGPLVSFFPARPRHGTVGCPTWQMCSRR